LFHDDFIIAGFRGCFGINQFTVLLFSGEDDFNFYPENILNVLA
jgi:hypothetical protein